MTLEVRLEHLDDQAEIVMDLQLARDECIGILVELQERVYKLMYGAYYLYNEDMTKIDTWEDCCNKIYKHNVEMWNKTSLRKLCYGNLHERINEVLKKYMEIHLKEKPYNAET